MNPANFGHFLPLLAKHSVECILIGGGAGILHGRPKDFESVAMLQRIFEGDLNDEA